MLRETIVNAFIAPSPGHAPDRPWKKEIQTAFEYPLEIEFSDALPISPTGTVSSSATATHPQDR